MGDHIRLCSHCNNTTPHQLIVDGGLDKLFTEIERDGKKEKNFERYTYFFLKCSTCGDYSLLGGFNRQFSDKQVGEFPILFPASNILDHSVPKKIQLIYSEAFQIRNKAPNAFAGQIRRAIEYLCNDKGAKGSNLAAKLNGLVEMGIIPNTLNEMTTIIRLLGNLGVHATEEEVSQWDAQIIDEFFRSIIEYVYIAPAKLDRVKYKLELKKLRSSYGNLLDNVVALLFEDDPIDINFETNTDEYEYEAVYIVQGLKDLHSQEELISHIHAIFVKMFDSDLAGPKEKYYEIAGKIWRLWEEKKKIASS